MTDTRTVFALWEQGLAHAPYGRVDAMLRVLDPAAEAPRSIGEGHRRLLELHVRLFGDDLQLASRCPQCDGAVQFNISCRALMAAAPPAISGTERVEVDGHVIEFRLPLASDVALVAASASEDEFPVRLARRCIVRCESGDDHSDTVLDAISRRMEALDPLAVVSLSLACPDCSAQWDARLDVEHLLWTKVKSAAERLLLDVDALARAYGWTESEVLALPPIRRAAYLQLAGA